MPRRLQSNYERDQQTRTPSLHITPHGCGRGRGRGRQPSVSASACETGRTTVQLYKLSKVAREKLRRESARPDCDLLRLVGHVNLLDDLVERLEDADLERGLRWYRGDDVEVDEELEDEDEEDEEDEREDEEDEEDGEEEESGGVEFEEQDRSWYYPSSESDDESDDSDSDSDDDWEDFKGDEDDSGEDGEIDNCFCGHGLDIKGPKVTTTAAMENEDVKRHELAQECTVVEEVDLGSMEALLGGVQEHSYGSIVRTTELVLSYS
ncbi:hypothetical protein OQA88_9487 [Cercophora sp. LCS_1]